VDPFHIVSPDSRLHGTADGSRGSALGGEPPLSTGFEGRDGRQTNRLPVHKLWVPSHEASHPVRFTYVKVRALQIAAERSRFFIAAGAKLNCDSWDGRGEAKSIDREPSCFAPSCFAQIRSAYPGVSADAYAWKAYDYPPNDRTIRIHEPPSAPVYVLHARIFWLGFYRTSRVEKKHGKQFSRLPLRGFHLINPPLQPPSRFHFAALPVSGSRIVASLALSSGLAPMNAGV